MSFRACHDLCIGEAGCHAGDFDSQLLPHFGPGDEDDKPPDLGDPVAAARKISDFYIIFFADFNRFGDEAPRSPVPTSWRPSTVSVARLPHTSGLGHKRLAYQSAYGSKSKRVPLALRSGFVRGVAAGIDTPSFSGCRSPIG